MIKLDLRRFEGRIAPLFFSDLARRIMWRPGACLVEPWRIHDWYVSERHSYWWVQELVQRANR